MSQTIKVPNYSRLNTVEETQLIADAAAAQASLSVESNQNFAANSHVVIGRTSSEESQKITLGSVTGTQTLVASANLSKAHSKYDSITRIFGDKIRIYRAANVDGTQPLDASFALLSPVDIDFDQQDTSYTDTGGGSGFWYKFTYYDSVGLEETDLSASIATRGGNFNYASLESIRKTAGINENPNISDALVEEKRQAAQSFINSNLVGKYELPLATSPVNPLVGEMTRLLAAGYILTQETGTTVSGRLYAEGQAMIDRVTNTKGTGLLDRVDTGTLSLLDETKVSTELSTGLSVKGWPNSTTEGATAANGGAERMFRASDEY